MIPRIERLQPAQQKLRQSAGGGRRVINGVIRSDGVKGTSHGAIHIQEIPESAFLAFQVAWASFTFARLRRTMYAPDLQQQALDAFLAASAACMTDPPTDVTVNEDWQRICDRAFTLDVAYQLALTWPLVARSQLTAKSCGGREVPIAVEVEI